MAKKKRNISNSRSRKANFKLNKYFSINSRTLIGVAIIGTVILGAKFYMQMKIIESSSWQQGVVSALDFEEPEGEGINNLLSFSLIDKPPKVLAEFAFEIDSTLHDPIRWGNDIY